MGSSPITVTTIVNTVGIATLIIQQSITACRRLPAGLLKLNWQMKLRQSKSGRYLKQYHIDYIKEHGETLTMAQLSEATGFSQASLSGLCKKLGVTPTKSFFQLTKPTIPKCEP